MLLSNIIKTGLRVSKLWSAHDFGFTGDNYITKKKVIVVSLAHDTPTGSPPSFLPNIIMLCQTEWQFMLSQTERLQGKYLHKEEKRVVSVARGTPTGPLHFYQTLSKYV